MKGKQPKPRPRVLASNRQCSQVKERQANQAKTATTAGQNAAKGKFDKASQLSRSTSIFQNSQTPQRRRR